MEVIKIGSEMLQQTLQIQAQAHPPALHEESQVFASILREPAAVCLLARIDGEAAGYLLSYPSHLERTNFESGCFGANGSENVVYVHDVAVLPKFAGQGVAAALLQAALTAPEYARFSKFFGMAISTSISFWQKHGFAVGEVAKYRGVDCAKIELVR